MNRSGFCLLRFAVPFGVLGLLLALPAQAQVGSPNLYAPETGDAPQGIAQVGVVVQRYAIEFDEGADARTVGQVSTPLFVVVPLRRDLGVSVRAVYASGGVDGLEGVSGLADAQLGVSYRPPVRGAEVVVSLGVGLPLGNALASEQLASAVLLSRNEFAFEAPALRQGFRLAPGVTVAVPAGEHLAFGAGLSYQLRQPYRAFDDAPFDYAPGNELLVTGGFDARLGAGTVLSADAGYALYGDDAFGDQTLTPGNKLFATLGIAGAVGRQEIHFATTYRRRENGTVGDTPLETPVADALKVELGALLRIGEAASLGLSTGARYFGDFGEIGEGTESVSGALALADHQLLFDFTLAPAFRVTSQVDFVSAFTYALGLGTFVELADVTPVRGFRATGGLAVTF